MTESEVRQALQANPAAERLLVETENRENVSRLSILREMERFRDMKISGDLFMLEGAYPRHDPTMWKECDLDNLSFLPRNLSILSIHRVYLTAEMFRNLAALPNLEALEITDCLYSPELTQAGWKPKIPTPEEEEDIIKQVSAQLAMLGQPDEEIRNIICEMRQKIQAARETGVIDPDFNDLPDWGTPLCTEMTEAPVKKMALDGSGIPFNEATLTSLPKGLEHLIVASPQVGFFSEEFDLREALPKLQTIEFHKWAEAGPEQRKVLETCFRTLPQSLRTADFTDAKELANCLRDSRVISNHPKGIFQL